MALTFNYRRLFFLWHSIHFRKRGQIHNQNIVCEILRERNAVLDAIILLSRQMHLTPIPRKICASYFEKQSQDFFAKSKWISFQHDRSWESQNMQGCLWCLIIVGRGAFLWKTAVCAILANWLEWNYEKQNIRDRRKRCGEGGSWIGRLVLFWWKRVCYKKRKGKEVGWFEPFGQIVYGAISRT